MADETKDYVEVVWTYMGLRPAKNNKLLHTWLDHEGIVRSYDKLVARAIGGEYRVFAVGESQVYTSGAYAPQFIRLSDHEDIPEWKIYHEETVALYEAERYEKKVAAESKTLGDLTLRELAAVYQKRTFRGQRTGVLAAVIEYLQYGKIN